MAMMSFSYDLVWGVGVWRFQGSVNSDADYERYISSLHELDVRMRGRESTAIVVVDRDNPTPNAAWRKRMAEATRTVQSTPLLVFVSESRVARAVVTAINWIRPPPYEISIHASFEEAVVWLAGRRPGIARKVYDDLMDEASRARPQSATKAASLGRVVDR